MSSFKDFHLRKELFEALKVIGFSSPTPVQKLVLPRAIKKESLMVQSATGSGKTHSFLIPILQNIDVNKVFTGLFDFSMILYNHIAIAKFGIEDFL